MVLNAKREPMLLLRRECGRGGAPVVELVKVRLSCP